jgi:hypothetical protein
MTTPESRPEATPAAPHPAEARVVKPLQLDAGTPQTGPAGRGTLRTRRTSASAAGMDEGRRDDNQVGNHKLVSLTLLAVSLVAVLAGVVFGRLWLGHGGRGWPVLLPAALFALIGVLDIVWACHARTARRLAVLDAYAEREIARSSPGDGS